MGLYESNYLRLTTLAGYPPSLTGTSTSRVDGDCELRLSVVDRSRYTTDLSLTYLLPAEAGGAGPTMAAPDMLVRAYHDARLVEALPAAGSPDRDLQQCWSRNMMLNKLLEYCTERGHRFP